MAVAACLVAAQLVPFVDAARPSYTMESFVPSAAAAEAVLFDGTLAQNKSSAVAVTGDGKEPLHQEGHVNTPSREPSDVQDHPNESSQEGMAEYINEIEMMERRMERMVKGRNEFIVIGGVGVLTLAAVQLGFPYMVRTIRDLFGEGKLFRLAWRAYMFAWGLVTAVGALAILRQGDIDGPLILTLLVITLLVLLALVTCFLLLIVVVTSSAWKSCSEYVARERELSSLADESHADLLQDFELFEGGDSFITPSLHPYGKAAKVTLKKVTALISQGKDISGMRSRVECVLLNLQTLLGKYNQKVAESPAVRKKMEEAFAGINEPFRKHYGSTMDILVSGGRPSFEKLEVSVKELAEKHTRSKDMRQTTTHPIDLVLHGAIVQDKVTMFARQCAEEGANEGKDPPEAMGASIKDFMRLQEKLGFTPEGQWNAEHVFDVAREGIQVMSWDQFRVIVEFIASEHGKSIEIQRVKNRLSNPTPGGWADVMINFTFAGDTNRHICEIQIFHAKMFLQRSDMGGHEFYGKSRTLSELLEFFQFSEAEGPAPAAEEAKPEAAPAATKEEAKPAEAPAPAAEEAKLAEAEAPAPAAEEATPGAAPAATTEEAKPAEAPAPAAEEAKPAEAAPAASTEEAKPAEAPAPAPEEAKQEAAPAASQGLRRQRAGGLE